MRKAYHVDAHGRIGEIGIPFGLLNSGAHALGTIDFKLDERRVHVHQHVRLHVTHTPTENLNASQLHCWSYAVRNNVSVVLERRKRRQLLVFVYLQTQVALCSIFLNKTGQNASFLKFQQILENSDNFFNLE